jgi:beta-glucanase (GH16 family)
MLVCALSWLAVGSTGAQAGTPSAVVASDACGATLPKPEGGAWACTFVDEFSGRQLNRQVWLPQPHGASGTDAARACYVDDPDNVSVRRGNLRLTVRKESQPLQCADKPANYTAGSVSTYRTFGQQYGRFEARIKVADTEVPGLQEAFWLWPDDRVVSAASWPANGEIDIAETYSLYPHIAVPFLHYGTGGGPQPGVNTAWDCPAERGVYNTYVLTWTPTTLTIDINGRTCLVNNSADEAFQKPYIAVFTSALGVGANALTPDTPIPAQMSVDYLKVWK